MDRTPPGTVTPYGASQVVSPETDSAPSAIPYVAFPIIALLWFFAIARVVRTARRERDWFASITRRPGDMTPGPAQLAVEVPSGIAINLGYSDEAKGPSGSPTLRTEAARLAIVGGPPIELVAGTTLQV